MSKKRDILSHYEPRIGTGRENFDVLDWASAASQRARFAVLAETVELSGRSLLDVGCGLGDLLSFLRGRGIEVNYTGVDISAKMLTAAQVAHSDARFVCADIFSQQGQAAPLVGLLGHEEFDVVFCSGVFNLNLGNNSQFLPKAIARLMKLTSGQLVFNLLRKLGPDTDPDYACYEPAEVMASLAAAGWNARLVEGYLPNDFTIICQASQTSHR